MTDRNYLLLSIGMTAALSLQAADNKHPNIIYILADDLGYTVLTELS